MDIILCFNDYSSVVKAVGVNNGGGGKRSLKLGSNRENVKSFRDHPFETSTQNHRF